MSLDETSSEETSREDEWQQQQWNAAVSGLTPADSNADSRLAFYAMGFAAGKQASSVTTKRTSFPLRRDVAAMAACLLAIVSFTLGRLGDRKRVPTAEVSVRGAAKEFDPGPEVIAQSESTRRSQTLALSLLDGPNFELTATGPRWSPTSRQTSLPLSDAGTTSTPMLRASDVFQPNRFPVE